MRKLLLLAEATCVLCVCLLAVLLTGQWLNLTRPAARVNAISTTDDANNLRLLGQAVNAYTQDYDETLPPMQNAQVFQTAVRPFAVSAAVFYSPETGLPYTPNAAISGKLLNSLSGDTDTIEVARDSQPHADGLYTVVFLDGTVEHGGQIVGDPNRIVTSRAKILGLAVQQYTQDYDEILPPMHTPDEFQTALFPYTRSHNVFYAPNGKPFLPNASLSGVSLASIADPSSTVLLMDQPPYVSGAPTLAYLDGHVFHNPQFYKHILWTNTDGTVAVWNYSTVTGSQTNHNYGPYAGWSAKAIADGGTDGQTRLLWTNTDGRMSIWSLDNSTAAFTNHDFGPYTGWTAKAVSVGPDNTTHIVWNNTSGAVSVWNYSTDSGAFTQNTYGPYAGWSAKAIADGGTDGKTRLLWNNTNGAMSVWSLDNTSGQFIHHDFGPYAGWTADGISVSGDDTTHVLWTNTNGTVSVWNADAAGGTFTENQYGPYAGWTARAVSDAPGSQTALLWTNTNGAAAFWNLDNSTGSFAHQEFGPYSGWSAVGISAAP